jgi:hypothetical protein
LKPEWIYPPCRAILLSIINLSPLPNPLPGGEGVFGTTVIIDESRGGEKQSIMEASPANNKKFIES